MAEVELLWLRLRGWIEHKRLEFATWQLRRFFRKVRDG
jgi:hypothetical protein